MSVIYVIFIKDLLSTRLTLETDTNTSQVIYECAKETFHITGLYYITCDI